LLFFSVYVLLFKKKQRKVKKGLFDLGLILCVLIFD
jgi:hypothetical protein